MTARCRVPMWMGGFPAGHCNNPAYGDQYPPEYLWQTRNWRRLDIPHCHGPCCPGHGGPKEDEIRIFQDGWTNKGRQMWCAVFPDFINLQESPAGFDGDARIAVRKLKEASK